MTRNDFSQGKASSQYFVLYIYMYIFIQGACVDLMQLSGFELCFRTVEVLQSTPVEAAPQVRLPNSFLLLERLCRLRLDCAAIGCHSRDQDPCKILEEL